MPCQLNLKRRECDAVRRLKQRRQDSTLRRNFDVKLKLNDSEGSSHSTVVVVRSSCTVLGLWSSICPNTFCCGLLPPSNACRMPRPRVRPEDRQRATKACLPCKASKKRCDAQQPCSNCVRRRNPARCKYEEATYVGLHDTRPRDTASLQTRSESPARPSTNESNQHPRHRQRTPHPGDEHARLAGSTATSRRPSGGRLLLNAKGEKGMWRRYSWRWKSIL